MRGAIAMVSAAAMLRRVFGRDVGRDDKGLAPTRTVLAVASP
jgi:hypothetical protein